MTGIDTARYSHPAIYRTLTQCPTAVRHSRAKLEVLRTHLLHHLTAYGAGLTAGQIAVIALLEVYADPRQLPPF